MKRNLLQGTWLAGVGMAVALPVSAGDAPDLIFAGNLSYEYIFVDNDARNANGNDGHVLTANEQQSELVWDARGVADNGLEYGANIQWRWARGDRGFDEAWIDFRGDWGRFYIGAEDGVTDLWVPSAKDVQVGSWGTDGNGANRAQNAIAGGNAGHLYSNTVAGHTLDANKLGYLTPTFGGFDVGVSFAPDNGTEFQDAPANNDFANSLEFVARYRGALGGFGVEVAAGYVTAKAGTAPPVSTDLEDFSSYLVGAQVDYGGFSVASQWYDNGDSACPSGNAFCDAGTAWNIGASYTIGPTALSLQYQTAQQTDNTGVGQRADIYHAGFNHTLAEGLSARANGYFIDGDQGLTDDDATVLILGTRIQF